MSTPTHEEARDAVERCVENGAAHALLLDYIAAAEQNERLAKVVRENAEVLTECVGIAIEEAGHNAEWEQRCRATARALADALKGGT